MTITIIRDSVMCMLPPCSQHGHHLTTGRQVPKPLTSKPAIWTRCPCDPGHFHKLSFPSPTLPGWNGSKPGLKQLKSMTMMMMTDRQGAMTFHQRLRTFAHYRCATQAPLSQNLAPVAVPQPSHGDPRDISIRCLKTDTWRRTLPGWTKSKPGLN